MRKLLLLCCLALAATLTRAAVIDIDNAELAQLLQQGVPIIDIRLQAEWEETGIVASSQLLTFFDARGRYDAGAWLTKLKPLTAGKEAVIVICRTGNRTRPVSRFLAQQGGYAHVYNVKHGIKGWIAGGNPVVPAAPSIAACRANQTC